MPALPLRCRRLLRCFQRKAACPEPHEVGAATAGFSTFFCWSSIYSRRIWCWGFTRGWTGSAWSKPCRITSRRCSSRSHPTRDPALRRKLRHRRRATSLSTGKRTTCCRKIRSPARSPARGTSFCVAPSSMFRATKIAVKRTRPTCNRESRQARVGGATRSPLATPCTTTCLVWSPKTNWPRRLSFTVQGLSHCCRARPWRATFHRCRRLRSLWLHRRNSPQGTPRPTDFYTSDQGVLRLKQSILFSCAV